MASYYKLKVSDDASTLEFEYKNVYKRILNFEEFYCLEINIALPPVSELKEIDSIKLTVVDLPKNKFVVTEIIYNSNMYVCVPMEDRTYSDMKHEAALQYGDKYVPPYPVEKRGIAHAPYNFVPLNSVVVNGNNDYTHDIFDPTKLSGYIDLHITTKTPTFIRGIKTNAGSSRTLELMGKPILPGSSIRGLTKNLMEICTWARMADVNNTRLYFRGIAEPVAAPRVDGKLKWDYNKYIGAFGANVKGGYLKYHADKKVYKIHLAINGGEITKIQCNHNGNAEIIQNNCKPIFHSRKFSAASKDAMIGPKDEIHVGFILDEEDIINYQNDYEATDSSRPPNHKVPNLIKEMKKVQYTEGIPVLFIEYLDKVGNTRYAFGHTLNFRVPYLYTIREHLPECHTNNNDSIDIPTSIFGTTEKSSRVFFEDALWESGNEPIIMPETHHKILGAPKPTAVQMYLRQNASVKGDKMVFEDGEYLKNWNDISSPLRGYKLYWHRYGKNVTDENLWKADANKFNIIKIEPINVNQHFRAHIRFENLSEFELGAILFVLALPQNCCHKIGLGKPLGLGSIAIKPELTIINRKERYSKLLSSNNLNTGAVAGNSENYIATFEKEMIEKLKAAGENEGVTSLWQTSRLIELMTMLDYTVGLRTGWLEATRYMTITPNNEYKTRAVLPKPLTVKKRLPEV